MQWTKTFRNPSITCKLCWTIAAYVSLSVIVAALIVIVPFYQGYKKRLINHFEKENLIIMRTLLHLENPEKNKNEFIKVGNDLAALNTLQGALVFDKTGTIKAKFGDIQALSLTKLKDLLAKKNSHAARKNNFYVFWGAQELNAPYEIFAILNSNHIDTSLQGFLNHYIDAIFFMVAFLVLATLFVVYVLLLKPILNAKKQIQFAAANPGAPKKFLIQQVPKNELGDIFKINNQLLMNIHNHIQMMKHARKATANLNKMLEQRVKQRTRALTETNLHLKNEIKAHIKTEEALMSMASLADENINPVLRVDANGKILYANAASELLLKFWQTEVYKALPQDWQNIVKVCLKNKSPEMLEVEFQQKIYLLNVVPVSKQNYVNIYGIDVTQRKTYEEKLQYLSVYEPVTGLYNSHFFEELLIQSSNHLKPNNYISVLSIEINDFRSITQTIGRKNGELLLKEFSKRLKENFPSQIVLAHASSNHFLVGILDLEEAHIAGNYAAQILTQSSQPFNVEHHQLHITLTVGIALYPLDAKTISELIKNSDLAMFHARSKGQNQYQYFTEAMNKNLELRHRIYQDLYLAVAKEQFHFEYQPQFDLKTKKIVGVEALLRWTHPEFGVIQPEEFIDILEQSHLIDNLTFWLFNQALLQQKKWREQGLPALRIGVNLTSSQLHHPRLMEILRELIDRDEIAPQLIEIEITERAAIEDTQTTGKLLHAINQLGFSIAIDDFGSYYSSLRYLQSLPINVIKIDKSFLENFESKHENKIIINAIIKLAHNLNIKVICEGVEEQSQVDYLLSQNCDEIQGFYLSKPLPADEFVKFVKNHQIKS